MSVIRAVFTDVDGTLTDGGRRLSTEAILVIRALMENGVAVVLASGNTTCFMDALCKMIGTGGQCIAENGGVYRLGYGQEPVVLASRESSLRALDAVESFYQARGTRIERYSHSYRFADVAFARTVPVSEVRNVVAAFPVEILDTGFAIHIHEPGITKGTAFLALARVMKIDPSECLAVGDGENDADMIALAGAGATPANGHPALKKVAGYVAGARFGDGFVEAARYYFPHFLAR